jgi:hypothetical protein
VISECAHALLIFRQPLLCQGCCTSKTNDVRHIFSSCAPALLVASAVNQWFKYHTLPHIECTNTLRCAKLVADYRQKIDSKLINTDCSFANDLGCICVE